MILNREPTAVISACGKYRYLLTRPVSRRPQAVTFILLNPSTADATRDDPTIRRCIGFAQRWGCGQLVVLNLFGVRATDPADLKRAADPVGPKDEAWFARVSRKKAHGGDWLVVCGWGVHGSHLGQDSTVLGWLAAFGVKPVALGTTRDGHPRHPLYMPYTAELAPFVLRHRRS